MMELAGYVFEPLRVDSEFALYRGRPPENAAAVLLLAPLRIPKAASDVLWLEHEVSLAHELDTEWAVRPLQLVRHNGQPMLMLEDPGGQSLAGLLDRPLELTHFLRIACGLAAALRKVHQRGFIHRDIKPWNVLVGEAGDVRLMGFGMALRVQREHHAAAAPEIIAGTPAYMAPEQTGRMNRSIDARSDLYSLGVTLYEMLTGTLPFTVSDPMELIHCHIARAPPAPSERVSGVPAPIEAIILKLLAKTPEDRYQTATGVEADLRRCLSAWEVDGCIEDFQLGNNDVPDRPAMPQKLFGRERDIDRLAAAFDRVRTRGNAELVLVSGYAGIGKSSVVNELQKVVLPAGAFFAAGKADEHKGDIPYATLGQAFQGLMHWILGRDDAELGRWRDSLLEALGPNGQLMVNLIPELGLVVGEPTPMPEPPPQDVQIHFQMVFRRLLGVFARAEHPLVLFLDDLQWLDTATLTLVGHLLTHPEVKHLLVIGAYRDNEVDAAHPLAQMLAAVGKGGGRVETIALAPLTPEHVGELTAAALHSTEAHVRPLAELVFGKTGGNPFFAIQFIAELIEEGLIGFDAGIGTWIWDLTGVGAKGFTDNVADLMAAKLNRLPVSTQEVLGQLACLGNAGETATLALIQDATEATVHSALWPAVRAGIVHRFDGGGYAFVHDRIREAAYAIVPEDKRPMEHIRIGRLLASRAEPGQLEETVFDIVNQFDRGASLITDEEERRHVGALNLMAGMRAKAAGAYQSALQYLTAGRRLLSEQGWEGSRRNTFDLELNLAECEYLVGDLRSAEERLAALTLRAGAIEDLAAVTCLRIDVYTTLDRGDRATEVGLEYLRRIDDRWPQQASAEDVQRAYDGFWELLGPRSIESLVDLPLMTDTRLRATMDVLTALAAPAMYTDENLFYLIVGRMADLSLEHGNSDGSCFAYVWMGAVLGSRFGDYPRGFRFGRLGLDLAERPGLDRFRTRAYLVFGHRVGPWMQHLAECRPFVGRAFEIAQSTGDISYANYSRSILIMHLLAAGERLDEVQREAEQGLAFARRARFGFIIDIITAQLGLIRVLRGLTREFDSLNGDEFDEDWFEQHLEHSPQLKNAAFCYWVYKLQSRFHAGDYEAAVAAASNAAPLAWTAPSQFETVEYYFYAALAKAALCNADAANQERLLEAAAAHHSKLALWAQNNPASFSSRAALVAAEIARFEGRDLEAMRLYEDAIHSAREHGLVQIEGLANELAAQFHAARGFETIAAAYLRNARFCYLRWGAEGKVRQLDQVHPHLRYELQPLNSKSMVTTPIEHLDLATVIKVSQAISREIDLKRFINTLMATALEHAGGDRGLLIIPQGDELWVEAEAKVGSENVDVQIRRSQVAASTLPESVLHYAVRSQSSVLLADASDQNQFSKDEYFVRNRSRSILCLPLVKQLKLIGVLYIENSQTPHVFTPARMSVLSMMASQAAISLENAYLYAGLKRTEGNLAEAQRLSRMGTWVWDLSTNKVSMSEEHRRLFGFAPEQLVSSFEFTLGMVHPEDRPLVQSTVEEAVRTRKDFHCEFRAIALDGTLKHMHSRGGYAVNEITGADEYVGTVIDVTERKHDEEEMRKLVSLIENSTDFIGYCSPTQQVRFLNAGGRRLIGLDLDEDITKYYIKDFRAPEDRHWYDDELFPILMRDGQWVGETYLRHVKTHALIPVLQTVFFIFEKGTGQRIGTATICRDISERRRIDQNLKASLQEKEALLKEVHHRVKNNLQLISSLLNLQANRIADPAVSEQFTESRNRVRSMALVHENLYRAGNFARIPMRTHIQNLCAHLIRAYGMHSRNVELVTGIDDVELDLDRAISSGLIINELVSNALKHAFPDDRPGSVRVELKLISHKQCVLTVKDDGIGLPADFNVEYADSLGLQLVHDLIRQLHGATSVKRGNGTSFSIAFTADGFAEGPR